MSNVNSPKELIPYVVTRGGSRCLIYAHSASVGRAGELEFMRYDDSPEAYRGWYFYKVMAPGSWTDLEEDDKE